MNVGAIRGYMTQFLSHQFGGLKQCVLPGGSFGSGFHETAIMSPGPHHKRRLNRGQIYFPDDTAGRIRPLVGSQTEDLSFLLAFCGGQSNPPGPCQQCPHPNPQNLGLCFVTGGREAAGGDDWGGLSWVIQVGSMQSRESSYGKEGSRSVRIRERRTTEAEV